MRRIIKQSLIPSVVILLIGLFLLIKNNFFTEYNGSVFNNIMTPVFTIISIIIYFLTLVELKKSYDLSEVQHVFISTKKRLESIRQDLFGKKFNFLDLNNNEESNVLFNSSNSIEFYRVYNHILQSFHNIYIEERKKKKDSSPYFREIDSTYHITGEEIPFELLNVMNKCQLLFYQLEKDFNTVDILLTTIMKYEFNVYQDYELRTILNEIFNNLDYLFKVHEEKSFMFSYVIKYKNKEFELQENQIPGYYPDSSFKPMLSMQYKLQSIYENYKRFVKKNG